MTRGTAVARKANPAHEGVVNQINRGNDGTRVRVRWNNGWLEWLTPADLCLAAPVERHPSELQQVLESLHVAS